MAASLPWSTSATGIFLGLWLIALVPTLDSATVRRELGSAAGGLPVLLWMLAAIGMLWADVSWIERIRGYGRLSQVADDSAPAGAVPPLRSGEVGSAGVSRFGDRADDRVLGPRAHSRSHLARPTGSRVPVKDYILQSEIFAIVAFGLIGQATEFWRVQQRKLALVLGLVAMSFFANVAYVATGRTTLVAIAVLLLLFGLRQFGWKGALGLVDGRRDGGRVLGVLAVSASARAPAVEQIRTHGSGEISTIGLRLEYWKDSVAFIAEAPVLGQGTGTIPQLFGASRRHTAPYLRTVNPHNQVLAVAIELGLPGAIVLIAMWIAHVGLFHQRTLNAWYGLIVVFREHRLVAVQLAPVRLQQRMALCPRCRCHGRCDIAGPNNAE